MLSVVAYFFLIPLSLSLLSVMHTSFLFLCPCVCCQSCTLLSYSSVLVSAVNHAYFCLISVSHAVSLCIFLSVSSVLVSAVSQFRLLSNSSVLAVSHRILSFFPGSSVLVFTVSRSLPNSFLWPRWLGSLSLSLSLSHFLLR